jgi:hypothetical protein
MYLIGSGGALTAVGAVFDVPLTGTAWDIDFNPSADRLRIVSNSEQNMRWNPSTGADRGRRRGHGRRTAGHQPESGR